MPEIRFLDNIRTQELIDETKRRISSSQAAAYTTTSPITDSADGMVQGLTIKGRSHKSKNLFDITSYPLTESAWIHAGTGDVVENDAGTACTLDYIPCSLYVGQTLTLNKRPAGNNPGIAFYNANKIFNSGIRNLDSTEGTPWTFTVPTGAMFMRFTTVPNNQQIQLELGSTATAHESYGIHSVGDNGLTVQTTGKNLFDPSVYSAYLQQDGTYRCGPWALANISISVKSYIGKALTFSAYLSRSESYPTNMRVSATINGVIIDGTAVNANTYTRSTLTITPETENDIINITYGTNGVAEYMYFKDVQLEFGTTATVYEPYNDTMATFSTALPLRSVSDTVRDKLICTAESKQVEAVCGEVDLGDLEWEYQSNNNRFAATLTGFKNEGLRETPFICERYEAIDDGRPFSEVPDKSIYSDSLVDTINIHDYSYSDAATFKTAVTGIKLVYPLATPTTTPLTAAEISAFRGLRTYDNTTNVTISDNPEFEFDYLKNTENGEAVSRVVDDLQGQINTKYQLSEGEIIAQIADRIYQGTDLTVKFALEIATYNNDPWAWIKARITAGNFTGIHIGDYIPFTTTNNVTLIAQIAGINTYKNYGDSPVGAHIDFICKELWPTLHPINKVNYNNGTAAQIHPWLASDLYLYLNSLSGDVPNGTSLNPETVAVDYTADGVYYFLPTQLKNVIIEKKFLLPTRYSASGLLSDDDSWAWKNIGKLWLPDECEVYGVPVWGGKGGYSIGGSSLQYPLFAGNMNRLKFGNGSRSYRSYWWLLSPYSGDSTYWCSVGGDGFCYYYASNSYFAAPVCFRIA